MSIVPHILTSMSPRGEFVAVDAVYGQEKALRSLSPRSDIAVGCIDTSKLHGPRFRKAQIVVLQLLANGTILLPPDLPERIVQPVSNIELVLKSPPYPSHNYRHIISFQRSCLIPVQFRSQSLPSWPQAGTYILSGGLGTLGLKIASWLVNDHGAHHLVFLSRVRDSLISVCICPRFSHTKKGVDAMW
jgi:KR domain.